MKNGRRIAIAAFAFAVAVGLRFHDRADPGHVRARAARATRLAPPVVLPPANRPLAPASALEMNAARPFDATGTPAAAPFAFPGDAGGRERALACLAAAAWYEAGDDPAGERAVIQSVLNRARHPAFPATVCGVVFQGQERSTGCQYSFTCDGSLRRTPSAPAWRRANVIAAAMLAGTVDASVGYATHYHTDWVVPYWSAGLIKIAKVHTQIFYRWPGFWGTAPAFRRRVDAPEPIIAALARLSPAHLATVATAPVVAPPAAAAPRALPPPIVVAGASERSLRGTVVRGQPAGDLFLLQLADDGFAGDYAIAALAVCRLHPHCRVFGWRDASRMAHALPPSGPEQQALSFYYARDEQGAETMLWDCRQTPRSRPAQCLPTAPAALAALTEPQ